MITIDHGMMFCAISDRRNVGADDTAYLNRHTGEIVFLHDSEGEDEAWFGQDVAVDNVFVRGRIDAAPDDWLEIPKCRDCDEESFIHQFLHDNKINAELR